MLEWLEVSNFALMREVRAEFGSGLTIFSGETGAGKSILIEALTLLCGERATRDTISRGANRARVQAQFSNVISLLPMDLREQYCPEEDVLILEREVSTDGRSYARINSRLVTLSQLRAVSKLMLTIHAQHEQLSLYDTDTQRLLLDRMAGPQLTTVLEQWQTLLIERRHLVSAIKENGLNPRERERKLDLLSYQIDEIEKAQLHDGEEEALLKRLKTLSALERIEQELSQSLELLESDESGILRSFSEICKNLNSISGQHADLSILSSEAMEIAERCSELRRLIQDAGTKFHTKEGESHTIHERLDLISGLEAKYGDNLQEVLSFLDKAIAERQQLIDGAELLAQSRSQLMALQNKADLLADEIHQIRQSTAEIFSGKITEALKRLEMPHARFEISVLKSDESANQFTPSGRDEISFLFSANLGEEARELARIASGGEASRVLLAIQSILADFENIPLLIFDEVDSGISGRAALAVGQILKELSSKRQIFCVSHLANIAALADEQFGIIKTETAERSETVVRKLSQSERKTEIARLLSGEAADDKSLELAEQMLKTAR